VQKGQFLDVTLDELDLALDELDLALDDLRPCF